MKRFFFQSALDADTESPFPYLRTKARAEEIVRASGIPFTIFRPSLIVGPSDGFTVRTRQLLSAGPVVPVPGRGRARFQPLYVEDWVRCVQAVLTDPAWENRTVEVGGPEQLTYLEILRAYMQALGMDKPLLHLPMGLMRLSVPFLPLVRSAAAVLGREIPEVTSDLLGLLDRDNVCDPEAVERNFGFQPSRLADVLPEITGRVISAGEGSAP